MRLVPSRGLQLVAAAASGALIAGGGYAIASTSNSSKVIHGCVQVHTRLLEVKARCTRGTQRLTWNMQGPQGPQGAQGAAGQSPVSAFAVAEPGEGVGAAPRVAQNATLVVNGNGSYHFQPTLDPNVLNTCAATATPIQAPSPNTLSPTSADTVTEAEYRATNGAVIAWNFQVYGASGQPVNDGIAVTLFCPAS